jgi:MFS family permease
MTNATYAEEIAAARAANNSALVTQLETVKQAVDAGKVKELSEEDQKLATSTGAKVNAKLSVFTSVTSICINVGAFFGMFCFGPISQRIGRKPTFVIALLSAFVTTATVFWVIQDMLSIFLLVPIMGFCQLSLFGGYAIYFPELFPTHLRSTGTSFCYNVGRFVAAFGPLIKIQLNKLFQETGEPLRYAGVTMCAVFLVGLFVLPFLPETRGKPLPE